MNVKEVKVTGTVPPFFGQSILDGKMSAEEGSMSDEDAATMWRWFGMPLSGMNIKFNTQGFLGKHRFPFSIEGITSTAWWWIEDLLYMMQQNGAIIETAKARDLEDGDHHWEQLHPQKHEAKTG
jgi:hypothetical protein